MTLHISLPSELEDMVHTHVKEGMYSSASEFVRQLLRDFFTGETGLTPEQEEWARTVGKERLDGALEGKTKVYDADTVFNRLEEKHFNV